MIIKVTTQAEMEAALKNADAEVWLIGSGVFTVTDSVSVTASDSASVTASDSVSVTASDSASVTASDSVSVTASDSASVTASDSVSVTASDSASIRASDSVSVTASDSVSVRAWDSVSVTAWDSVSVTAWGSASVTAWGSASVRASGSVSVTASDSVSVTASDSVSVRAWGSASVTASGSVSVTASGSVSVTACPQVAVRLLSPRVTATGGIQIRYKTPETAAEWLENYGVKPVRGVAILYKGVNAEYRSPRGGDYTPGTTPACADWDGGKKECGGGFHFSPAPFMTLKYAPEAVKYVACPVKVSEIVVHKDAQYPDKVKAPRVCDPCYEVDIDGKRIIDAGASRT